jgi:hypothetical protein
MENPNIHRLLAALKGVKEHKDFWTAQCPSHEDNQNSLSVTPTNDGKILLKCHTGCAARDVVYATGMIWNDMFPEKKREVAKKITATYDYLDSERILTYQVCRMEWEEGGKTKKTFVQRRPDGKDGFTWKTKGLKKILYRLPELLDAPKDKPVFVVEGEKQVDYLRSLGLIATCNTGGAGSWLKAYGKLLTDRDVIVIPDCDPPNPTTGKITGAVHAVAVADSCLTHANTVHVLQLPNCGEKWGLDDWLEAGNTMEELGKLLQSCPQYPEGEIVTQIKPDADEEMEDPLKRYREMLESIGITYCAQTDDGRVEIFSTERRKFSFLPFKVMYPDLIKAAGLIVIRKVKEHAEDAGDISMAEMKVAIAAVSSATEAIEDKRGQGCWNVDESRIAIVNSGELGILNGRPKLNRVLNPMLDDKAYAIGSSSPWIDFDLLEADLESKPSEIHQKELDHLVKLIGQFDFGDPQYRHPELIAGLFLASVVQTCWPLRPQVFLIGRSYSGKTTLLMMMDKLLGNAGRRFSQPSAAGLRAFIKQTAKVVMLDEVEKSRHRKEIFEMIRASARGDSVIRSSANQSIREYSINNIFWCAAIEPGIIEEADKTRFLTIEMKRSGTIPEFPADEKLNELGRCLSRLAICSFREALRLIEVLKEEPFSESHGRLNECYAVPAAAYAAARGLSDADAVLMFHAFMKTVELDEDIENDHKALLQDIFDGEIRNGAEVLHVGSKLQHPDGFSDATLAINGICKDMEFYYFSRGLLRKSVLRDERWRGVRIDLLLMRLEGAERKQKRFGASVRQAVAIPIESVNEVLEQKYDNTSFNPFAQL